MLEIKVHVIHEWRPGHADPLARIERSIELMSEISDRLSASADQVVSAIALLGDRVGEVATAIRNHPAATTDNGVLASIADKLDSAAHSAQSIADSLTGLAAEENAEDQASSMNQGGAPAGGDGTGGAPAGGDGTGGAPAGGDGSAGTGAGDGTGGQPAGGGDGTVVQQPQDLSVSPGTINGTAGQAVTGSITVSGGTPPYSFSSSLPELQVDTSGNVSGTPSVAGDGVIIVSDSGTPPQSTSVSVSIAQPAG